MTQTYDVRITNFEATPSNITFSKGTTITFYDSSQRSDLVIGGFTFNLFNPPSIPPGSVFPIPQHVRLGDVYGPTGADYTGLDVLPVISDVKLGVGYGGAGVEFTGTLVVGGGGGTFPLQTQVKLGVVYGPNGNDYTGNVTLPGIGDVRISIQYGANGTEFTGTLNPVGGGGTRRIRFIE